jgi:prepilin-type N-terminal cleavage/methylation domain-containing protein
LSAPRAARRHVTTAHEPKSRSDAGFSLIEVLVALMVTVIAILGLAYSFSTGRTLIDRYAYSRAALSDAQGRMELLSLVAPSDTALTIGTHMAYFMVGGQIMGTERWVVSWVDDPVDGLGASDPNPNDLKLVSLSVDFQRGTLSDTLKFTRLVAGS